MTDGAAVLNSVNFEVSRHDLRQSRLETEPIDVAAAVAAGKAVLALDHFALTANNITYAAFGDQMSYWNFFPAAEGFGASRSGVSPTSSPRAPRVSPSASGSTAIFRCRRIWWSSPAACRRSASSI